jgi:TolA-binding protein
MYPPKVQDDQIRAVIRELTINGRPPSGAALRDALARRYGSRGGVARIYSLLGSAAKPAQVSPSASIATRLLEHENGNLREQLKHAREREEAHQQYWAREIGQLRQQIQALESAIAQATAAGQVSENLRQRLRDAEVRGGQLEVALRVFGPAAGRPRGAE